MKVSIKNPCHEDWDKMNPTEKGRFCKSCETEVVDFTKMTKSEIKDYFVKSTSEICARIEDDKLYSEKKSRIKMRPIWVAAASMFVFSKVGITQGRAFIHPEKTTNKTQYKISTSNEKYESITIEFQLLDSKTKKGIPFTDIRFVDLDLHIKTDENGNCQAIIPTISEGVNIEIDSLKYTLIISAHKDLKYTFELDKKELKLVERKEIDRTILFDIAKTVVDSVTISGVVLDSVTKKPIPNIEVEVYCDSLDTEYSTLTDSSGNYKIKAPKSKEAIYEIYVFRRIHEEIEIIPSKSIELNILVKKLPKRKFVGRTIGCPSF